MHDKPEKIDFARYVWQERRACQNSRIMSYYILCKCSNSCCFFEPCCQHEFAKPSSLHLNYLVCASHPGKIGITKDNIVQTK